MTNNIGWAGVAEGQENKELTINSALERIDHAITEVLPLNLSVSDVLAVEDLQQAFKLVLTPAGINITLTIEPLKKFVYIQNAGNFDMTLACGATAFVLKMQSAGLFYLDGSTDGFEFVSSGGGSGGGGGGDVIYNIPHRKWRMLVQELGDNPSPQYFSIGELEFRATVGGPSQRTGGSPIAGYDSYGLKANAFDGNLSNEFTFGDHLYIIPDGAAWLGYDYGVGNAVVCKQVAFTLTSAHSDQGPTKFKLQYADDDGIWYDLQQFTPGVGVLMPNPAYNAYAVSVTGGSEDGGSEGGGSEGGGSDATITVVQSKATISDGSITLDAPPTKRNLLVAIATHFNNGITIAPGWFPIPGSQTNGGAQDGVVMAYRYCTGGETALQQPYTGSNPNNVAIWELKDVVLSAPYVAFKILQEVTGTSLALPFDVAEDCMVLGIAARAGAGDGSLATITGPSVTIDKTASNGSNRDIKSFHFLTTEAASPDIVATWSASTTENYLAALAIAPRYL